MSNSRAAQEANPVLLSVEHVSKSFGGVKALIDVSVQFRAGEVHALLGENGAGKSTLVKIIAGVYAADDGSVASPGGDSAHDVAMVFQELSVLPDLSVRDNLAISLRTGRNPLVTRRAITARVRELLDMAGLTDVDPDLPVSVLTLAQRQLLEIARGLAAHARTLILDEPTATLSDAEIERVHRVVRSLVAEGRAIVYITHRMGEVFALSDRVTVMRSGQVVASGPTSTFTMDRIVAHMLGEDVAAHLNDAHHDVTVPGGRTVTATGLSAHRRFHDIHFEARSGRITAFFGQIGSGADEVVRAVAGLTPVSEGQVSLDGAPLPTRDRSSSQRAGVAYVSPDRVVEGVFLSGTVTRNITSGALRSVSRAGVISANKEYQLASGLAPRVAFDPGRTGVRVGQLSGGNQQKIAIARALATRPKVLVLNEPTRGVDIGARAEIYKALRQLAADNVVVLVYTSDIVEIRELADDVVTMFRGRQVATHDIATVSDADILSDILQGVPA
jgi:ribose transport system ATP-binding protein